MKIFSTIALSILLAFVLAIGFTTQRGWCPTEDPDPENAPPPPPPPPGGPGFFIDSDSTGVSKFIVDEDGNIVVVDSHELKDAGSTLDASLHE